MGTDLIERLKSEGWVPRFTASGARLREAIENYRQLGFEVKSIAAKELAGDGCTECFEDENERIEMIFTKTIEKPEQDDLFENMGG